MLNAQLFPSEVVEHDRNYPPHSRCVEIDVKLLDANTKVLNNSNTFVVYGSDLTKEYVEVNADYRS